MKLRKSIIFINLKIIFSGLVSEMEGKLNGSKIYKGRNNTIMSNKVKPHNPNTGAQIATRSDVRYYSGLWQTGFATFMKTFNAGAKQLSVKNKIGTAHSLAGFNWFLGENCRNKFCYNLYWAAATPPASLNADLTTVPPLSRPTMNGNIKALVAVATGTPSMVVDVPMVSAGDIGIIYATPPLSAGKTYVNGKYRPILGVLAGAATPAKDILAAYVNEFGSLLAGKVVHVRFEYVNILGSKLDHYYSGAPLEALIS